MKVQLMTTTEELLAAATLLRQLRPNLTLDALLTRIAVQQTEGYCLAGVLDDEGRLLCVGGFCIRHNLSWGKHLFLDDLVTDEERRSSGAGACLLDWLKSHARGQGCAELHLESGVQRHRAHKFYLLHGFDISCHHFGLKLS